MLSDDQPMPRENKTLKEALMASYEHEAYEEALDLAEQAMSLCRLLEREEESDVANLLNIVGLSHMGRRDFATSRKTLENALAMFDQIEGGHSKNSRIVRNNLAYLYLQERNFDGAATLLESLLQTCKPSESRFNVTLLLNLSRVRACQYRFAEAMALLERALPISERLDASAARLRARVKLALGVTCSGSGDARNALAWLRQSVAESRAAFPRGHSEIFIAELLLGRQLLDARRLDEAGPFLVDALDRIEEKLGSEHSLTGIAHGLVGLWHYHRGALADARRHWQRALDIHLAAEGERSIDVAGTLGNLALLETGFWRVGKVRGLVERALAICRDLDRSSSPTAALMLNNLAQAQMRVFNPKLAARTWEEALRMMEQSLGPDHWQTGLLLNNLAVAYTSLGQMTKAEHAFRRALEICEATFPVDHPQRVLALQNLGQMNAHRLHVREAEAQLCEAFNIGLRRLGPHHHQMARCRADLTFLYLVTLRPWRALDVWKRYRLACRESHDGNRTASLP